MIKEIESYCLLCDSCKRVFIDKYGIYSLYLDRLSPLEYAQAQGWIEHKDKHYCPECYEVDGDDNIIIKESEARDEETI